MGVDPYLIAAVLLMAVGQRLVPTLCEESKEAVPIDGAMKVMVDKYLEAMPPAAREQVKLPDAVFRAKSAPTCPSGTRGRMAGFEVIEMDRDFEHLLLKSPSEDAVYQLARQKGVMTMREDALLKALAGKIPFEEVAKL